MKLKICGLMTANDVHCVNQANVDFAGFVFTRHRQQISVNTAKMLKSELNPNIKSVGVFVDEDYGFVKHIVDEGIVDLVQFHGSVEYEMPCPTIRSFRIKDQLGKTQTACDYVLFDAFARETTGSSGGMFNWQLLKDYDRSKPFFIAGGINRSNIKKAMAQNPYCIDISSGVEENGAKSLKLIMEVSSCIKTYCQK